MTKRQMRSYINDLKTENIRLWQHIELLNKDLCKYSPVFVSKDDLIYYDEENVPVVFKRTD
jgi:hypothetical protein